jgi:hypothetical protein
MPDMMMTMFMPLTVSDGFAFVASWAIMMVAMMLPALMAKAVRHSDAFLVVRGPPRPRRKCPEWQPSGNRVGDRVR